MGNRNRVAPTGEIVDYEIQCCWMGNRGCLHRGHRVVRRWRSLAWITCATEFKGRRVEQWAPGRYTVLFLYDEAVALAAGHRPCAEYRRSAYNRFRDTWEQAHGARPSAADIDSVLHRHRVAGEAQRTHRLPWAEVPDGTFVRVDGDPALVLGDTVVLWADEGGYAMAHLHPDEGDVEVLTPAPTVAVLRAGYEPQIHPEAHALLADLADELQVERLQAELAPSLGDLVFDFDTVEALEALRDPAVGELVAEMYFDPLAAKELVDLGASVDDISEWLEVVEYADEIKPWLATKLPIAVVDWFVKESDADPKSALRRFKAGERPPDGWELGDDPEDFVESDDDDGWEAAAAEAEYPPDRAFP